MLPHWRIYYADGSTYSDQDGVWFDAPADGIVAVNTRYPAFGARTLSGVDYYYCLPMTDEVHQTDDLGPFLRRYVPDIKFGVALPRERFMEIVRSACADPDFPRSNPQRRYTDGGVR